MVADIDEDTICVLNEALVEGLEKLRSAEEKYGVRYKICIRLNAKGYAQVHVDPADAPADAVLMEKS